MTNMDPAHLTVKYLDNDSFDYEQADQEARCTIMAGGSTSNGGSLGSLSGLWIDTELRGVVHKL